MKSALFGSCFAMLVACDSDSNNVNSSDLPEGWAAGDLIPTEQIYSDPAEPRDPERLHFFGLLEDDAGYRLYSVPADTPVAMIVEVFRVGSHGAMSYRYNADEMVEIVARKATEISEMLPCRVTFAASGGLTLKFLRPVTNIDLDTLSELFPEGEGFQAGAEGYIIEQSPGRHLFERVKAENRFQFFWD